MLEAAIPKPVNLIISYKQSLSLPKVQIMSLQKYPIGHQDFEKIITEDFVYVDKTKFVHQLATRGGYYFLSRPRRFGKSLFVSTLDYLFRGHSELFKDLYIADKWKFEEYPVIKISFSTLSYEHGNLATALSEELENIATQNNLKLTNSKIKDVFEEIIFKLHEKHQKKVVVLIDEYDKPLIDYLDPENLHLAQKNRGILKSFYSILKDADPHLKLVFITGISKFSQVSIFSDLNNLYDISLDQEYNSICGINQNELEENFTEELKVFNKEKIKNWYNGYRWDIDAESVYNPFSLLSFFSKGGDFVNFWYTTGTPTFLVEMCRNQKLYELKDMSLSQTAMNSFNIENLQVLPILFQAGYLTIKGYDSILSSYQLDYPNKEVKSSYVEGLLEMYSHSHEPIASALLSNLLNALKTHSPEDLTEALNQAFAHIPYDLWQKENEHFYHAIVHLLFSLLGVYIHSEVHTKRGRADAIVNFENNVYCLEFKLDQTAAEAMAQIRSRGYVEQYKNQKETIHLIGINFSSEKKEVEEVIWEEAF